MANQEKEAEEAGESDSSVLRQLLGFKGATTDTKAFLNWKVLYTPGFL